MPANEGSVVPPIVAALLLMSAVAGEVISRRQGQRLISLAGAMLLWCALVLVATHRVPFARVALFALPLVALLAGLGIASALERVVRADRRVAALAIGSCVLAALLGATVVVSRGVILSRETGTLRDAEAITTFLATVIRPGDRVVAPVPSNGPLMYHFART